MASSKGNGPWNLVILMVLAVVLAGALSAEDPDVRKLDSREFQRAVDERAFALNPEKVQSATRGEDQAAARPQGLQKPGRSSSSGSGPSPW